MIVSRVRSSVRDGRAELSAEVRFDARPGRPHPVWFRFEEALGAPPERGDPFLTGLVLPCMMLGEDLRIDAPVSAELIAAIETRTIPLVHGWHPHFGRPRIEAAECVASSAAPAPGVAVCFSTGIDSCYSLEKHHERVTHLLSLRGYDRTVDSDAPWAILCARSAEVARELGARFVPVETNLRNVARSRARRIGLRTGRWQPHFYLEVSHGSFLVAVAQCLTAVLGELVIGSSFIEEASGPWGSHPELDPSWSTRALRVRHDGGEADRIGKIRHLAATSPKWLRAVSVCHSRHRSDLGNCARCPKCLLTLAGMRIAGASDLAESFAEPLSLGRLAELRLAEVDRLRFEWTAAAAAAAGDRELARALRAGLRRSFGWRRWLAAASARVGLHRTA